MPVKKTTKTETIVIKPVETEIIEVKIVGDSPLIMHAWDAKARRMILYKQIFGKTLKEEKKPLEDFVNSLYWLDEKPDEIDKDTFTQRMESGIRVGFPATAFKQAAISSAYRLGFSSDKASIRGAFFVKGNVDGYYGDELDIDYDKKEINILKNVWKQMDMIEIEYDEMIMREDMVRVGMGTADIRYRAELDGWKAKLRILYNKNGNWTRDNIINMVNAGGYTCGIGEWRPERDGQYGMFHISP